MAFAFHIQLFADIFNITNFNTTANFCFQQFSIYTLRYSYFLLIFQSIQQMREIGVEYVEDGPFFVSLLLKNMKKL